MRFAPQATLPPVPGGFPRMRGHVPVGAASRDELGTGPAKAGRGSERIVSHRGHRVIALGRGALGLICPLKKSGQRTPTLCSLRARAIPPGIAGERPLFQVRDRPGAMGGASRITERRCCACGPPPPRCGRDGRKRSGGRSPRRRGRSRNREFQPHGPESGGDRRNPRSSCLGGF